MSTGVAVLGSTGSIGVQTLEVIRAERDSFHVAALGAHSSIEELAKQANEFRPDVVGLADETRAGELRLLLPDGTRLEVGPTALADIADADVVINGVVGFAGLGVTIETLRRGKRLGLANKESLISAGPAVAPFRATPGAELIPVDSEHCAIHQCLRAAGDYAAERIARVILTASGGPFRGRSAAELASVTVEEALDHPTWSMGPKITVDSSTLMNKGLEVIEAHELFGVDYDDIEVVVHPQSIVHSMAEFTDAATIAQLSLPDMRLPIGYALAYPDRISTPFGRIEWSELGRLDFEPPDHEAFPCLGLAYDAGRAGGGAPAWLNAANEIAVEKFLAGLIRWCDIGEVLKATLAAYPGHLADSVDDVIAIDAAARRVASAQAERIAAA